MKDLNHDGIVINLTKEESELFAQRLTTRLKLADTLVIRRHCAIREALGGIKAEDSSLYKRTFGE